jgi:hypothetical protein
LRRADTRGFSWQYSFDESILYPLDSVLELDPGSQVAGTTWFLFKAVEPGQTDITFSPHSVQGKPAALPPSAVFSVTVTAAVQSPTGT